MARYGRDYGTGRGWRGGGPGYDMGFANWGERSGLHGHRGGYDGRYGHGHGRGGGWGMEGLFDHVRHGEPWDQDTPTPYHSAEDVRGQVGYGGRGGYGGDYRGRGGRPLTGMESKRYRGVYGSDFRVTRGGYGAEFTGDHGGYRGVGWNRGGGMNPGRGPYPGRYDRGWF